MSLADQILSTPFLRERRPVSVSAWPGTDGKLFIRNLSALEHEQYVTIVSRANADPNVCLQAEVAALVLVDGDGNRVFTTPEQIKKLADGDIEPLSILFEAFTDLLKERNEAKKKFLTMDSSASS